WQVGWVLASSRDRACTLHQAGKIAGLVRVDEEVVVQFQVVTGERPGGAVLSERHQRVQLPNRMPPRASQRSGLSVCDSRRQLDCHRDLVMRRGLSWANRCGWGGLPGRIAAQEALRPHDKPAPLLASTGEK